MRRMWALLLPLVMVLAIAGTGFAAPGPDGVKVRFDDQELQFDANPFVENDRTLVPIRALAERLGFTVDWNEAEQKITLTKDTTTIVLWIDSNKVVVNGVEGTIDVPAKKENDRTFVPLRFLSEKLGAQVAWDEQNNTAVVTSGKGLLARMNQQQAKSQDMKGTMTFAYHLQATDPATGKTQEVNVPATMDMHVYHNDMLMSLKMQMPGAVSPLTIQFAIKDGKTYQQDPLSQQWRQTGSIDLSKGAVNFSTGAGATGFGDIMKLSQDMMKNAVVTVGGTEQVDGVDTIRVDVDLSKYDFGALMKTVTIAMQLPQLPDMKLDLQKYTMSYWLNPQTQFVHKMAMDMQYTLSATAQGKTTSVKMIMQGEMLLKPVSEPIQFPDFTAQAPTVTPEQKQAMEDYLTGLVSKVDLTCFSAAEKADANWTSKTYTAGHDAAVAAGGCFTKAAQALATLKAPAEFAEFHAMVAQALDNGGKAYAAYANAFDLAAKGDATWQTKKAEADTFAKAAQTGLVQSIELEGQLETKYGLE